jgi:hypothetical protein
MKTIVTFALAAVVSFMSADSHAQDIRVRIGSYFGGGVARQYNANCATPCNTDSPASTVADRVIVDSSGNIYVAGHTSAIDLPTTTGAYSRSVHYYCERSGTCISADAFVAKFNKSGQLLWSTYLKAGFPGGNSVMALTLDSNGNIAVAGRDGTDLPPCQFPFFLKLNSAGSATVYKNTLPCTGNVAGPLPEAAAFDPSGRYIYAVTAASGSTLASQAMVSSKTQDLVTGNNTAPVSVKVQ